MLTHFEKNFRISNLDDLKSKFGKKIKRNISTGKDLAYLFMFLLAKQKNLYVKTKGEKGIRLNGKEFFVIREGLNLLKEQELIDSSKREQVFARSVKFDKSAKDGKKQEQLSKLWESMVTGKILSKDIAEPSEVSEAIKEGIAEKNSK
jgi:hypothetical protein